MNSINSLNGKLQYSSMVYLCALLENDCETCHWGASGDHMRDVHELADEYRNKAHEMRDWFGEHSIMNNQEIDNITNVREHVSEQQWPALKLIAYDLDTFLEKILERGKVIIECIEATDDLNHDDERSDLSDFLGYWRKEIEFYTKMTQGSAEKGILSNIDTNAGQPQQDENLPEVSKDYKGTVFAVVRNPSVTKASLDSLPNNN
jgi:DNA-binding ferritin-like protein